MLDTLKFVRGAVAEKDLIPILTHFSFYNGRMQGTNGRLTIDADSPHKLKQLNCTVPAEQFLCAIDACEGAPAKIQFNKKDETLRIGRNRFTVKLTTRSNKDFPITEPDIIRRTKNFALLDSFALLRPFIGEDATRLWACGVLLKDGFAYATNNIVICRTECTWNKKAIVNIPGEAVIELLRIGEEPAYACVGETSVTFIYDDGSWLKTQLVPAEWPDVESLCKTKPRKRIPEKLREVVERLVPFCPDKNYPLINLKDDAVYTDEGINEAIEKGFDKLPQSTFHATMLLSVLTVATHLDFAAFPGACPFTGNKLTGSIVGVLRR